MFIAELWSKARWVHLRFFFWVSFWIHLFIQHGLISLPSHSFSSWTQVCDCIIRGKCNFFSISISKACNQTRTYTVGEKKKFDPLLILYVCPLTKKWSVYHFNGRFIWTVRDRITTKMRKNAFKKSYKLICIFMSEISIWSPINQYYFWLPGVFLQVRSWD